MTAPAEASPLDAAYSERARLVAFLTRVYPSHWAEDPESPGWPVICVHSPAGQMCWHVGSDDVPLFPAGLETRANDWDGHTTAQKYERLGALGLAAAGRSGRFSAAPGTVEHYVWRLIGATDRMAAGWAETAPGSPRRNELWRDVHSAADIAAAAMEEGPAEAERMTQAGRAMRERECLRRVSVPADDPQPRRFQLHRDVDVSGVSGTGIVADGVVWPDGSADVRWRGDRPSAVHWDRAEHAEQIHGHAGATRFVLLD
ncbi:hypothetical protein [Parafrankia sp. EUN1f]|uniref:hypothetical protein n=1 Tax=Parafrankia sp. EUN1f TaxID=102897 RepID=UPI0001C452EA|nr:hypothetical protein [Parafrankia sp. EUN1f]EFC79015.1 hypothetical protein FrEUN1fDRAFT_7866 [Parafrankia sp. EUN1f]